MNTVKREKLFELCIRYLDCLDISRAAKLADIEGDPSIEGARLLCGRSAKRILKKLCDPEFAETAALAGLMKLALGRCNDAVELLREEQPPDISALDLYNVSEIKKVKGGGVEIKFFNRLDAIEKLIDLCETKSGANAAESFFNALSSGADRSDSDD